ncbi:unnamed protein product [Gemmataceae bacterium]|nr:unnamed protein product [Gemmataceae bacterium]VTT99759.1 unnamed protein product [Gemmataceae bacterium]
MTPSVYTLPEDSDTAVGVMFVKSARELVSPTSLDQSGVESQFPESSQSELIPPPFQV